MRLETGKFVESAIEEINTIVPLTDAQFSEIQDKLSDRICAFEKECVEQVKSICIESVRGSVC